MQSLLPTVGDLYMKIGSMCQLVGLFNLSYATLETAYTYYKQAIPDIEKKLPADGFASDKIIRVQDLEDKQRQIINIVIENERLQSRVCSKEYETKRVFSYYYYFIIPAGLDF